MHKLEEKKHTSEWTMKVHQVYMAKRTIKICVMERMIILSLRITFQNDRTVRSSVEREVVNTTIKFKRIYHLLALSYSGCGYDLRFADRDSETEQPKEHPFPLLPPFQHFAIAKYCSSCTWLTGEMVYLNQSGRRCPDSSEMTREQT